MLANRHIAAPLLALIVGLGIFFRFAGIGEKLVWHDEVYTRIFAAGYHSGDWNQTLYSGRVFAVEEVQRYQHHNPDRSVADTIAGLAHDEPQHPPLYYVLARIWVTWFGDGIGTLRMLSALLSLLTFPAIYWLGRELFASKRIAWTGVALIAVSPVFVLYAQEAREYALWTVLLLSSTAALLWAIRRTPGGSIGPWAVYALLTVLAFYTAFSTAAVVIAHALYILIRERGYRGRLTRVSASFGVAITVVGALFLPWALILIDHFEAFQVSMAWASDIVVPRRELFETLFLNISRIALDVWPDFHHGANYLTVGLVVALIAAAVVSTVRRTESDQSTLLLLLILVPLSMLLIPDLLFGGIRSVSTRYLIPTLSGLVLALSFVLGAERERNRERNRSWPGPAALLLVAAIGSCFLNSRRDVVWTKGISFDLPQVAAAINRSPSALVVGNREQHHPGNLLALSNLLAPGTRMQFLPIEMQEDYVLPRAFGDVYLFSPIEEFRLRVEKRERLHGRLLAEDLYLRLWKLED